MHIVSRFVIALSLLVALPVGAQAQPADRTVSDTMPLDPDGTVRVENHDGKINVSAWNRSEVQYEARIVHENQETVDDTRIQTNASDDEVEIKSDFDNVEKSGFWGSRSVPEVHYSLRVPVRASVEIDDHGSSIRVEGVQGEVEIDSHDGAIQLARLAGPVRIDTHDGAIDLTDVDGAVEVDSHDGDLTASGLRGPLTVDTHDARIDASFASLDGPVEIDSHDARVRLTLPVDAAFTLRTDLGEDGDVDVQPEMALTSMDDGEIEATVNGGGPEIYVSAHDGSLQIETR
ncbi:DUF4097 family beta strand repeat-containing protein [Longibacter sp.]|uniref:DUF4097 family beta strand repeat-containing protein n=1 Tax=Longibacter sp. TaxID=2045415 RepID=UPI003EB8E70C